MGYFLATVLLICFIGTSGENLSRNKEDSLNVLLTVESKLQKNGAALEHDRFARHAEMDTTVTESVINHLMKELGRRYPQAKKQPKSLKKVIRNLKLKLEKYVHERKPLRTRPPEGINGNKGKKGKKGRKTKRIRKVKKNRQKQQRVFDTDYKQTS
ncbi:uncharacterized protein LOC134750786 [Cydia strobilella]|uniref:uncharacterized protein LOC134750786 n=1 Tax=Cydia strobilella TaxID=1100964 RepID=UPI003007D83A